MDGFSEGFACCYAKPDGFFNRLFSCRHSGTEAFSGRDVTIGRSSGSIRAVNQKQDGGAGHGVQRVSLRLGPQRVAGVARPPKPPGGLGAVKLDVGPARC